MSKLFNGEKIIKLTIKRSILLIYHFRFKRIISITKKEIEEKIKTTIIKRYQNSE